MIYGFHKWVIQVKVDPYVSDLLLAGLDELSDIWPSGIDELKEPSSLLQDVQAASIVLFPFLALFFCFSVILCLRNHKKSVGGSVWFF